jgi:hypothetical protein
VTFRRLVWLALIAAAPHQSLAAEASCKAAVGVARAQHYVEMCKQVSPATHPPCNVDNPCALIIDEIKRGCAMLGKDVPPLCQNDPR